MLERLDISEESAGRRLLELADEIDAWQERFETGAPRLERACPLIGDDRASAPYHVSHVAWMSLSAATDNIHAFRVATVTGEPPNFHITTRPYGAYPSLRAALEGASVVLWMLGPMARNERLLRRFRWHLQDGRNRDMLVGLGGETEKNFPKRLEGVRRLAEPRGISLAACNERAGFRQIVREAAPLVLYRQDGAEFVWRVLSGMAHGDPWAALSVPEVDRLLAAEDEDVTMVRLTTRVDRLVLFAEVVAMFVRSAYELLDRRRSSPYRHMPEMSAAKLAV